MGDDLSELDAADEALAESLVAEALKGYEKMLKPDALQDIREYLVDELLCTSYGQARLRKLATLTAAAAAKELVNGDPTLSKINKKMGPA